MLRGVGRPAAVRNIAWIGAFLPWETAEIMVGGAELDILRRGKDGIEPVCHPSAAAHAATAHPPLARLALEYQTTYLAHCICSHTDKACMADSLEARAPFLDRELKTFAGDLLSPAVIAADGLFEPRVVERLWREHQSGRANHYKKLWTLLSFLAWRRAQGAAIDAG